MSPSEAGPFILVVSAVSTALVHTLIPDHWLPFVLIGLARRWSAARTALWSGLSALIHVAFSLAVGFAGLALGRGAARVIGEAFESVSAVLLVAFGLGYVAYARLKGGHFHVGGRRVHAGGEPAGSHGPVAPASVEDDLIAVEPGGRGPLFLAVIIGLNPCVLVLPLLMKSPQFGPLMSAAVAVSYAVPALALMVLLTWAGVRSGRAARWRFLRRHGETVAGLGIALTGAVFLVLEG